LRNLGQGSRDFTGKIAGVVNNTEGATGALLATVKTLAKLAGLVALVV
jgi:hypothetical protein